MRAIWKGSIAFGLVAIPVALYQAAKEEEIHFHILCRKHLKPIHYKHVCEEGEELSREDETRGIEIEKGKYVEVSEEEIEKFFPKSTKRIEIIAFLSPFDIERVWFNKNYYVIPQKGFEKEYYLFKEALERTGKAALAKFVLRNKERLTLIMPYKNILLLTTLFYANEVRKVEDIYTGEEIKEFSEEELKLAIELVNMLSKKVKLEEFKDEFKEKLLSYLEAKIEGKETQKEREEEVEEKNLLELLRMSVKAKKKKEG